MPAPQLAGFFSGFGLAIRPSQRLARRAHF
jgi:hypothetical protein